MYELFKNLKKNRFYFGALAVLIITGISFLVRCTLFIDIVSKADLTFLDAVGIFLIGFFFDVAGALYFILPLIFYLWILPDRIFRARWHRYVIGFLYFLFSFILLFNAAAEWFFWDEFNTRFNFIAVDYLVYTNEVVGNIKESYPVYWLVGAFILGALSISYFVRWLTDAQIFSEMGFKTRSKWFLGFAAIAAVFFLAVNSSMHDFSSNTYANELAGNGMYELFAAFRNNELDYDEFYPHISHGDVNLSLKKILQTPDATYLPEQEFYLSRRISNPGPEKILNVVLISVESLSAGFLQTYGGKMKITPFLDSLAPHSLLFRNLYATGTRTVRGLEALSLSIPPTPGQSIVRRPKNENLFSMASVFNKKGYESKFLYGGYGYFDNMNYFFENNNYQVFDRRNLESEDITFENVWGVSDEDLYDLTLREIGNTVQKGKASFVHVMTTSNHRPFTYPGDRIDIPSGAGRAGAVKYTDYAIGRFLKAASAQPWYLNTVFIITADHCASSAGKTDLPVDKYQIPMLIFSPSGAIAAGEQSRLMSQIDIAPTLLGFLNFSYDSKFFGYDLNALPPGKERAFISTYQKLGYLKNDSLVILSPKKAPEIFTEENQVWSRQTLSPDVGNPLQITTEAITWYETSSFAFRHGKLNTKL